MHIIELRAKGLKRINAVTIRPEPGSPLVRIAGKNGQGKTSTLDAIWIALKGRAVAGPEPIRKGSEEAVCELDLGEMKVERVLRRKGKAEMTSELRVTLASGERVRQSPQAVVDALLGELTLDPLEGDYACLGLCTKSYYSHVRQGSAARSEVREHQRQGEVLG
jgi:DNA repair exonuclease SbcCD ATPase subunit